MYQILNYIKYWFRATNQHGVHSPFVYNFVTKGLYSKSIKDNSEPINFTDYGLTKKEKKVLKKILDYFQIELNLKENINQSFYLDKQCNKLYYNGLKKIKLLPSENLKDIEFIIYRGIYTDKVNQEKWKKLCAIPQATVTIDLFYFGLLFFRKEQRKEHFVIRV